MLAEINTDRDVDEVGAEVERVLSEIWPDVDGHAMSEPECSMSGEVSCESLKSLQGAMGLVRGPGVVEQQRM